MEHNPLSSQLLMLMIHFPQKRKIKTKKEPLFPGDMGIFHLMQHRLTTEGTSRIKMSDISRMMKISKPAATQAVDRLVRHGLVIRTNDSNDRRTVYIEITDKGVEQFQKQTEYSLVIMDRVIERMGHEDAEQFARLFGNFQKYIFEEIEESEVCRNG